VKGTDGANCVAECVRPSAAAELGYLPIRWLYLGFVERDFIARALTHPAEATPMRDALRTEIETTSMRGASTFYGVLVTAGVVANRAL